MALGPIELWGGVECTIARIKEARRDQLVETGHIGRAGDIDLIAGLGIRTLRYPIQWERIAGAGQRPDWSWTDARLERLRALGVAVIGGLLHHGSGPDHTDLLDPELPAKLADFAAQAAERYPWVKAWTPVNEPLTTARFSALYGYWYPHRHDHPSFLRALVNQCKATLLAMRAIRAAIPEARLVQTEDLGKTFSTAPLRYQARYENQRRWLSLDLLCGRVTADHPWHKILRDEGIGADELAMFKSGEGRPDLIGINHYLTSERFLDHRLSLYPDHAPGGNGRDIYIDAEAVRVRRLEADTGIGPRLREAWARYKIPLAITEVHHGCHRDEQLRWFAEVWGTARQLRDEGVDLRAATLWSLFGAVDWRYLLTEERGCYDSGAFDVRGPAPRPTILAAAAAAYASGKPFDHPVLDTPGWWRRPPRLYPWNGGARADSAAGRKLLITGASGTLGRALARICADRGLPFHLTSRAELDICDPGAAARVFAEISPWAVINTAGFVRVADAEAEEAACFGWNRDGAEQLARACAQARLPFVTLSTDLVFDGRSGRLYVESDPVSPAGNYGRSKAEAEARVQTAWPRSLIVRTAAFFGPWDSYNFAHAVLASLEQGKGFAACPASFVSPTYVPDLCHVMLDLLNDGETGIRHLSNPGRMSWWQFARALAQAAGFDPALIAPSPAGEERSTALGTEKGVLMRPLAEAITAFIQERQAASPAALAAE